MHIPGTPRARAVVVASVAAALAISAPSAATAKVVDDSKLTPHTHFVMQPDGSSGNTAHGASIPNIDSVKSTVRAYYNASSSGIADKTSSPYITEMKGIEANILANMPDAPADNLAVVFDADDTTLWTYDMEDGAMHFIFDPTVQDQDWVQPEKFPATPGMVDFVKAVEAKGYHVYGITGRPDSQREATLGNLDKVGYDAFNKDDFYTKWNSGTTPPAYVDCSADGDASSCSTVEYKAFTRKHIEDTDHVKIVLNIGDQISDLQGGYSLNSVKLPNPTYYLPSPDIAGAPASDADLTLPSTFDMAADGSSGLTSKGDDIPNIDVTKSTIRTYYAADPKTHTANKDSSPYISEMNRVAGKWAHKVTNDCTRGVRKHQKPAVVFDADDTTLWTYDMEDGNLADDGMGFNFNPTVQDTKWVQPERFPATPGMVKVVRAAAKAGCKVVGITGRGATQRRATLDNLAKYYYDGKTDRPLFHSQYYFTKWAGATPPAYVDCAQDTDATKCSTIEYKSSTRKYVEDHFGFDIVDNFGDQFSDLIGGSSAHARKLPNPTYYLP